MMGDCIVTRNEKDYIKSKVQVMSPKELINVLESYQTIINNN